MASRRKTREFVLQVLFAADAQQKDPVAILKYMESHFGSDEERILKIHRVMTDFARDLVVAVSNEKDDIDKLIAIVSKHWKLHRMNNVDRNILRMAVAEMVSFPEIPTRVTLNEAIDIGKKYGAENSAAFINGILDRINALTTRPTSAKRLLEILPELDQLNPKV